MYRVPDYLTKDSAILIAPLKILIKNNSQIKTLVFWDVHCILTSRNVITDYACPMIDQFATTDNHNIYNKICILFCHLLRYVPQDIEGFEVLGGIISLTKPYSSGLPHCNWDNHMVALITVHWSWRVWVKSEMPIQNKAQQRWNRVFIILGLYSTVMHVRSMNGSKYIRVDKAVWCWVPNLELVVSSVESADVLIGANILQRIVMRHF